MRLVAAALIAMLATPAAAGATAWQELAPGVRVRMISSDALRPDGTTLVGLELDMPGDTRTYWRIPGEAGIPTEIATSGSSGVASATPLWPFPQTELAAGYLDHIYRGPTVLPVALGIAGDAPVLEADVTMGICSEVCVPAMAHFSLPLSFAKPDAGEAIRLEQALATTPLPWNGPAIGRAALDRAAGGIAVTGLPPEIDPGSMIADLGLRGPLLGTPQKSPDKNGVIFPLLGGGDVGGLAGQELRLTFMTAAGPYETSLPLSTASTD